MSTDFVITIKLDKYVSGDDGEPLEPFDTIEFTIAAGFNAKETRAMVDQLVKFRTTREVINEFIGE